MNDLIEKYLAELHRATSGFDWSGVEKLASTLRTAIENNTNVYLCGNGGSAGNAMHLANDFIYGVSPEGNAMNVEALSANASVITCLGNDIGYENIFSHQLKVKGKPGDVLLVLSGSGNSPNIVNALEQADNLDMKTFAILGYQGGKAKQLAHCPIHFEIDDMQICEDLQIMVGHMLMKFLNKSLRASHG